MALRKFRPLTPTQRFRTVATFDESAGDMGAQKAAGTHHQHGAPFGHRYVAWLKRRIVRVRCRLVITQPPSRFS